MCESAFLEGTRAPLACLGLKGNQQENRGCSIILNPNLGLRKELVRFVVPSLYIRIMEDRIGQPELF